MDVQVVVIGAVVFVISAVLIYLISAFTMKEKTFEEVIAEQKRQQEAEKEKAKLEKKQEKDVRRKFKKKDKVKDKSPQASPQPTTVVDQDSKEHKMVELELEPEIIEPLEIKPVKQSKKKDKPAKSILHNKDEKTPVVPDSLVQEMIHSGPPPKDDLELKHVHEKDHKTKKEKPLKREVEEKISPVVEEMVMKKETVVHTAASPPIHNRPFKQDERAKDGVDLIGLVKSTNFSDSEVQSLTDILLSKQGSTAFTSDWNKKSNKGDPVALLKKQLEEKERSLQEAQQMAMSADTKLKEIRHEFNKEKMRHIGLEKNYTDKIEEQKLEVQALQSRMQHTHEQHMVESSQMRSRVQQLEAQVGDQSRVQRLAEENQMLRESLAKTQSEMISAGDVNSLKQKVSIMEKELSSNALKLNTSENLKKTLEQKVAKYEKEMKDIDNSQKSNSLVIEKRLEEMTQELRKSDSKNTGLHHDLQSANNSLETAHNECVALKAKLKELEQSLIGSDQFAREKEEKLKEANRVKLDMEGNLKNLQKKIEDYEKDAQQFSSQIQTLKQEKMMLLDDLKVAEEKKQKESSDAAKPGAQNGDIHAKHEVISVEEFKQNLSEKEKEIEELKAEVARKITEVSSKDTETSSLKTDIENKKVQLSSLQKDLDIQKQKNNELREKNWKAMDALDKAEKSVSEKIKSAVTANTEDSQKQLESNDKAVLQRLFPDITVTDKVSYKDWISEFEEKANSHLQSLNNSQSDNSAKYEKRISDLEDKISALEKQLASSSEKDSNANDLEKKINDLETKLKSANQEIDSTNKKNKQGSNELQTKVSELERHLSEAKKNQVSLQSQVDDYDSNNTKLQTQVTQYRNVLAETENKLTQLESSVELEEKKWHERLQSKEIELDQSQQELTELREELKKSKGSQEWKKVNSEYDQEIPQSQTAEKPMAPRGRATQPSRDTRNPSFWMKLEVQKLQEDLQCSEEKCSQLEDQVKQAEGKVVEYKVQIEESQKAVLELQTISDDLEELRKQLEAEKKKNKELASNVVKLNGIIKTGHDALTQEQNLVEQLRKQLASHGHTNSVGPSDGSTDVQELQVKFEEKEKQLEKEINANNLLKQRLASSQSSLNEAGTSV